MKGLRVGALLAFWILIIFHFLQIMKAWQTGYNPIVLPLALLLLLNSASFYAWGQVIGDRLMVASRIPSAAACALSIYQSFVPTFGIVEFSLVLGVNAMLMWSLRLAAINSRFSGVLRQTSRWAFTLAYTAGLSIQLVRFITSDGTGVLLPYWFAFFVTSLFWASVSYLAIKQGIAKEKLFDEQLKLTVFTLSAIPTGAIAEKN